MRCRGAKALDVIRPVDVIIRIVEENLHDLHRISGIARTLRGFSTCPCCAWRWLPARVPDDSADRERADRRRIAILTDGNCIRPANVGSLLRREHSVTQFVVLWPAR